MNDFNADQYRDDLRKKLGVKDMPMQKSDNVVSPTLTPVKQDVVKKFGSNGDGESVDPTMPTQAPLEDTDGGEEVNQEQVAPAMALLHTLLQSVDEQTQTSNDKETGVMWRSLHNYIWKNRNKLAKKMMDDAQ